MQQYAELVKLREPSVSNCIGFVDGVSVPVQCSSNMEEQEKFYNGYHGDTCVNNVFAFSPTGKIMFAAINYVGSWHDSQVCNQTKLVGLNQIATVFNPHYEQYFNFENYDRISRYFGMDEEG